MFCSPRLTKPLLRQRDVKKRKKGRKLSRTSDQRRALKKSLARSLFIEGRIKTTEAKAKELRPFAEKLITRARKKDVNARRHLARYFDDKIVRKIVNEIAPRYKERQGGYTRIIKLGPRQSDSAEMAIIELV